MLPDGERTEWPVVREMSAKKFAQQSLMRAGFCICEVGGIFLLEPAAITMMREVMLPLATLVTPNLREASILIGREISNRDEMREAARALVAQGARAARFGALELRRDADGLSPHQMKSLLDLETILPAPAYT